MPLLQASGQLTFLRVHETGSKYGPPSDQLDVEVIFGLDSRQGAVGFQLREGRTMPARQAMLDLLRDGFTNGWEVHTDYEIDDGRINGIAIRVWLTRPPAPPQPGRLGTGSPILVTPVDPVTI